VPIEVHDDGAAHAPRGLRRREVFGGAAVAFATTAGLGSAAASSGQDAAVLRFALAVEQLQAGLYRQALDRSYVSGELHEYASVVHGHEVAHMQRVAAALGSAAGAPTHVDFRAALADRSAFLTAAVAVEDLSVAGYDGQIPTVGRRTLVLLAEIVSVEARHAAWIRDIAGLEPAPEPADPPRSAAAVRSGLAQVGITIGGSS
jgi:hypothetical protein